ncbi:MAG: hypothetical protein A2035_07945 [Nitrospirae bacterium GWA2_42_11]|nr:MAG: hypothetical protein A2035_07945 [Nitrospirae bacterium GWA2_42_11]
MSQLTIITKKGVKMSRELVLKWPIPETVDKELEKEIVSLTKEEVVLKLFKDGKISLGYGAKLLGVSLADFMEVLKERSIPFTHYTKEDWKQDKKAADELMKLSKREK